MVPIVNIITAGAQCGLSLASIILIEDLIRNFQGLIAYFTNPDFYDDKNKYE